MTRKIEEHLESLEIGRQECERIIKRTNGVFFSVLFTKRTTGEDRLMLCRTRVTKYLKGGSAPYVFKEKKLISVFDLQKMEYRSIPLEGIKELTVDNQHYKVTDNG